MGGDRSNRGEAGGVRARHRPRKHGVDLNSENVARLIRESALVTFESPGDNMLANCTELEKTRVARALLFLVKKAGSWMAV
jgi:hypothetical protein